MDGFISKKEAQSVKVINLNSGVGNLKGINQCTELEVLILKNVENEKIDVSKQISLKNLFLMGLNNIDLDVSNNKALETIEYRCANSKINSFNNNTALKNVRLVRFASMRSIKGTEMLS